MVHISVGTLSISFLFFQNQWAINSLPLFRHWGRMHSRTWISLGYTLPRCAEAPWRKPNRFTGLFCCPPNWVQPILRLCCRLYNWDHLFWSTWRLVSFSLAQKSSLRDLIFGLVSTARARTLAAPQPPSNPTTSQPPPSSSGHPVQVLNKLAWLWLR